MMKRVVAAALLGLGILGASWAAYRVAVPEQPPTELARFVPAGALLDLQANNFSALLADWDKSQEKESWLRSKNFDAFSRSRLFLRLKDADEEFSTAAGVPANSDLLRQVAGKQTVFALYDIGKLQFLYITKLPSADFELSVLWQTRSNFESRTAGGVNFFYRKDPDSEREVAFAVSGDYLLLATRADLLAGSLELLAGAKYPSLSEESWCSRSVAAAGAPGDLRMILNLDKIVPSSYFRSDWIEQNVADMSHYSAAITDLTRSGREYREQRTLLRKVAAQPVDEKGAAAVADLERFIPASAGVYEANADPDPKTSAGLLAGAILAPHLGPSAAQKLAPEVQLGNGETGSAADFETRIDQPPAQNSAVGDTQAALQAVLAKNRILAQLQIKRTDRDSAGVFVGIHSAVAFAGESDWNQSTVQAALVEFVRPDVTTGQMGLAWKTSSGYDVLDGLWPLSIAVRGKYLLVSDEPALLGNMLDGMGRKTAAPPAEFAAGFDHRREMGNFATLAKLLDFEAHSGANDGSPEFFSDNIASLSSTLKNVSSEKVVIRDAADRQTQTVVYLWDH
jgi:hypothetical protein